MKSSEFAGTGILAAPSARRKAHASTWHGIELADDFAWLRAENWQEVMREPERLDPEIRAYLDAENAYTNSVMAPTQPLQDTLFDEMKGRIKEDDSTIPAPDGRFAYYIRYREGGQYPLFCRCPSENAASEDAARRETVLLDGDEMGEGKSYFAIGGVAHSRDHRFLAYGIDDAGSELYTLRVLDVESGLVHGEEIANTTAAAVWSADGQWLFYVRIDDNHRPSKVFRHRLGSDPAGDVLVYEEDDPSFFVGIGETQDRRFVVIHVHEHQTSEAHLIDAGAPESAPRLVLAREDGHEYSIEHRDGKLLILTNRDADDFRIVAAPAGAPSPENWHEIVPHVPGRLILSFEVLAGHLVRLERLDGLPRIVAHRFADGAEHDIAFDEEAYSLGLQVGYEFDTSLIRFTYSSMTTPARIYDYDLESRQRVLRKEQEVPSGHDAQAYVTRRVMAPAPDGELVPVSLLYAKDTPLDGSAPLYLYGYGAYGISIPAAFSTARLSLVDRGFVFAIAHIRGGKDKGYGWYRNGKLFAKKNSFTDFIAAADHMIAEGFTSKGRIVAEGRSAGGLLMGAVANMANGQFLGIVAGVPFVDVLNTMLDASLPLTPPEWNEWGNPISDSEAFEYIRSYCPYDNVAARDYPHMLVTGGLTDPRVTYWEPAKWVAKLRTCKIDGNLLIMRMNMEAGHGGRSGRFEALRETAFDFAFALLIAGGGAADAGGSARAMAVNGA